MIASARCGKVAPVPQAVHEQYDRDYADPPDNVVKVTMPKQGWVPLGDGTPRVSCVYCATDGEIVSWIWPGDD